MVLLSINPNVCAKYELPRETTVRNYDLSESELLEMDTEELLSNILNYPCLIDLLLYDDVYIALNKLIEEFDSIKELYNRENLVYSFMNLYSKRSRDEEMMDVIYLNILMLYPKFIEICNINQKEFLFDLISANNHKYISNDIFNLSSLYSVESDVDIITTYLIIDLSQFYSSPVGYTYTYKGTAIPLKKSREDLNVGVVQEIQRRVALEYPGAVELEGPTNRYNCHAYAWYYENQTNLTIFGEPYCIFEATPYVTDGSYTVKSANELIIGESYKVAYYDNVGTLLHSGVIESYNPYNIEVISKWGCGGLYRHQIDDLPYDTENIVFYKHDHIIECVPTSNGFSHNSTCYCGYSLNEPHNYEINSNILYKEVITLHKENTYENFLRKMQLSH